MNVVNMRTNILCIHGCHIRTNHKENVSCYSCISHHEMNVVNTRTSILYIHGCHKRTNHKEMSVVTHVFHTFETFIVKKVIIIQAKFRCQNFLRRSIHGCMRTCNNICWGVRWDSKMSYFHPLYLLLFLTFHRPINLISYHFHTYMWISP